MTETAPTFTEREPYEKGFAEIFVQDIVPRLDELERERRALFEEYRVRIRYTNVATVIGAGLSAWVFYACFGWWFDQCGAGHVILILFLVPIPAFFGRLWASTLSSGHRKLLEEVIIPAVCRFFDGLEYRSAGWGFDHERFSKLGVVPKGSMDRLGDMFIGRHRNTAFKIVDAEVRRLAASGKNIYTVFNGLLIEIDVPTEFSGSMQTSFLRYISGYVCSHAFVDGVLLLAVPVSSDLFERSTSGSQSRPPLSRPNSRSIYDCEDDIHEFLKQLTIAHRVIDDLHGDRPERPA